MSEQSTETRLLLLGFDARETFLAPNQLWTEVRRDEFLLRRDVFKPLSVDSLVWPSVFGEGLPGTYAQEDGQAAFHWKGPNQSLWDDLERLRIALSSGTFGSHCIVAVTLEDSAEFPRPAQGPPYVLDNVDFAESHWKPVGIDVADAWLTSGLSNCSLPRDRAEKLRASWGPALNDHHLFTDVKLARDFARLQNALTPEHAPFFAYRIWMAR